MPEITAERIERLKGQVPPGVSKDAWMFVIDQELWPNKYNSGSRESVNAHILRCLIADADAREAGPIAENVLDELRAVASGDGCAAILIAEKPDARAILARAGLGVDQAPAKPLDMNVSEEWLKRMADAEGNGCTSVGGLAVELGLIGSKSDTEASDEAAYDQFHKLAREKSSD